MCVFSVRNLSSDNWCQSLDFFKTIGAFLFTAMSKNALKQVGKTILCLEETAHGLSKANQDHVTYGPRIVVLTKKVGSLEVSLVEVLDQIEELKFYI